jgi:NDP-sugar pyrophosphorylase family protein
MYTEPNLAQPAKRVRCKPLSIKIGDRKMIVKEGKNHGTVALIFCGGKGTRMQPITSLIRKEMLPVGPQRKPLLAYIVEQLRSYGIRNIIFLGSQKGGDDIINYFGDGRRFGVKVRYHPDPARCNGTGHALLWAIKKLGLQERNLLVYYGDMFTTINIKELIDTHFKKRVAATIVVSERYILPKGVASVTPSGMVSEFEEKPKWKGPGKIAVGLIIINASKLIDACGKLPSTADQLVKSRYKDVMGDIVKHLVGEREVACYVTNATWRDIGSFQDYLDVQKESMHGLVIKTTEKQKKLFDKETFLTVFISYQISKENQAIMEDLLSPCLLYAGYGVISGARLNRASNVSGPPSTRAHKLIDTCDVVVAVATPIGKENKPSTYVIDEVTYALAKGKKVLLFVGEGTEVPGLWREQFTWTPFDRFKPEILIRDVLELLGKVE